MQSRRRESHDRGTRQVVHLGQDLPGIPEDLLLAHARGEVLFLCGAGISRPSGLPDFRELVCYVYRELDPSVHEVLCCLQLSSEGPRDQDLSHLDNRQKSEVRRFCQREFDVVLGMLERRLDGHARGDSKVRSTVVEILRFPNGCLRPQNGWQAVDGGELENAAGPPEARPHLVHKKLMRLADRGGATSIVTTNFDRLLQYAARSLRVSVQTYSLGAIPRPSLRRDFSGVFHIHGALSRSAKRTSDLALTDQDFGEFYLRRRVVTDFIYDAARLFNLVLVGYSANDPPMRYLLNAVAADESRFDDLKTRYILLGTSSQDPVELEEWRGRGIVPIGYQAPNHNHSKLGDLLSRWADLSAINGSPRKVESEIRRIVNQVRSRAPAADRSLFDHLFRRSDSKEKDRIARLASEAGADIGWLDAMMRIGREAGKGDLS